MRKGEKMKRIQSIEPQLPNQIALDAAYYGMLEHFRHNPSMRSALIEAHRAASNTGNNGFQGLESALGEVLAIALDDLDKRGVDVIASTGAGYVDPATTASGVAVISRNSSQGYSQAAD